MSCCTDHSARWWRARRFRPRLKARGRPISRSAADQVRAYRYRKAAKDANFTVPQTIMIAPKRSPNELRYFETAAFSSARRAYAASIGGLLHFN
jgi:hypothetical protein